MEEEEEEEEVWLLFAVEVEGKSWGFQGCRTV